MSSLKTIQSGSTFKSAKASHLVFGAGVTGLSFLKYLSHQGESAKLYDDNLTPEKQSQIKSIAQGIKCFGAGDDLDELYAEVDTLLLSPGVPHNHPVVKAAKQKQIELVGDVELFARVNAKPVIAITGSNAKSTVVSLVALMVKEQGIKVSLAGNIGHSLLDALLEDEADMFVLELSSFQLDITQSLKPTVSCILNVSPDHLDRYDSYESYALAKQQVYKNAEIVVFNREDALTISQHNNHKQQISFGMDEPADNCFGLKNTEDGLCLFFGAEKIIAAKDCQKNSATDLQNALAAMAIAYSAGISFSAINTVLKSFKGLSHRCEAVANANGVTWINDSKGTNTGATEAALQSMTTQNKPSVILIAGGDSKGADISSLATIIKAKVKTLLLIGKDAPLFAEHFSNLVNCKVCSTLEETVQLASEIAKPGDSVLLSPACASQDMFNNYQDRGDQFKRLVSEHLANEQPDNKCQKGASS